MCIYEIRRIEPGVVQLFLLNGTYRFSSSHHRHMLFLKYDSISNREVEIATKSKSERLCVCESGRYSIAPQRISRASKSIEARKPKKGSKINGLFVRINNEIFFSYFFLRLAVHSQRSVGSLVWLPTSGFTLSRARARTRSFSIAPALYARVHTSRCVCSSECRFW